MRDFRDAKLMAQTLRKALAAQNIAISHSESLELFAKEFGMAEDIGEPMNVGPWSNCR